MRPWPCPLAQQDGFFRDRARGTDECVADNGICPQWAIDNFDRYVDPFFEHLVLVVVSVAIGFAISFALAVVAHRRRWLVGPVTPGHRDPLHHPQPGGLLPAAADHRPRPHDGHRRADGVHALHLLPQLHGRPGRRARGGARRRARHGLHRPPAAVARGAAARAARDPGRPAHRADHHRRAGRAGLLRRRRRARAGARLAEAVPDQRAAGRRPVRRRWPCCSTRRCSAPSAS